MVISVGLVGPKARAKAVVDGHLVNIPEPKIFRKTRAHFKDEPSRQLSSCFRGNSAGGGASNEGTPFGILSL